MQDITSHTDLEEVDLLEKAKKSSSIKEDYSQFLKETNILYKPCEYYWQVGEISAVQGWILHLSVVISQLRDLLSTIIPILMIERVPFKIVRNRRTAQLLLEGNLGYRNVGKLVCIYPSDNDQASILAQKLIEITATYHGPSIPTDYFLGSILYTRYGSFNPIIKKSSKWEKVKHIYNFNGELVPDTYNVPFSMPSGQKWPFTRITPFLLIQNPRLLNRMYYPILTLKKDVKGKVVKALYFKNFWQIKSCVIKQGEQFMFADDAGRDIRDRLKWQYHLHQILGGELPLPALIDYFEENESAYLVIQYINGISLYKFVPNVFRQNSWLDLSLDSRLTLLRLLSQVLTSIQKLHGKGFLHRDITPENFLVNRRNKIYLIDMELTWSSQSGTPTPPFKLGTPGFMSPQQFEYKEPTVKDDIYALGSLLLYTFTGILPTQLPIRNPDSLFKSVLFLTNREDIANLIVNCLQPEPSGRPELSQLQDCIFTYLNELQERPTTRHNVPISKPDSEQLQKTIQSAISGLVHSDLLSPKQRWLSLKHNNEDQIGNSQVEMALYRGWHTGMAGPLWLMALAKIAGFDIHACQEAYDSSWYYLNTNHLDESQASNVGLYTGSAGIALALGEGLRSRLIKPDHAAIQQLHQYFTQPSSGISLSDGIAGQCLALMSVAHWLDNRKSYALVQDYISKLLDAQHSDGYWSFPSDLPKTTKIPMGFANGNAGIVWVLLAYLEHCPEEAKISNSIANTMSWLIQILGIKQSNGLKMKRAETEIVLLFIKAFEITKESLYREIAEANLKTFIARPIITDFTLGRGLASIGELYLEAYYAFNESLWFERANWITNVYLHCFQRTSPKEGHWVTEASTPVTADLFAGNAGVIHFLMRYSTNKQFNHPLWPRSKNLS